MKKIFITAISVTMLLTLAGCSVNTEIQTTAETQITDSGIYSFKTEGEEDDYTAYYIVDYNEERVFLFYADESADTCFALPIEEGDLNSGLTGNFSDGYSMLPFTMRYEDENQTDRVILTMVDAYDITLVETDLEEALAIRDTKTDVELVSQEASEEINEEDAYTEDGQVCHRDRIVGQDNRIDAIIRDVERGSGTIISFEQALLMEESLDVYSDSSRDIKSAYDDPDSPYRELMEALDEYINNSVKWYGTVTRGAVASVEEAERIISGDEPIDMHGPSSWTSDEVIAQHYAIDKAIGDDSLVPIVYVLDENISGVSITHLSRYGTSEREVLAPSGILYIVDSYETINVDSLDLLYIHVHEAV